MLYIGCTDTTISDTTIDCWLFLFVPGCLISFSKSNQNYRILSITYTFIEAEYKQILIIYKIKTLSKKNKAGPGPKTKC